MRKNQTLITILKKICKDERLHPNKKFWAAVFIAHLQGDPEITAFLKQEFVEKQKRWNDVEENVKNDKLNQGVKADLLEILKQSEEINGTGNDTASSETRSGEFLESLES